MSWIEVTLEASIIPSSQDEKNETKKRKTDTETSENKIKEYTFLFKIGQNQEIMDKIRESIEYNEEGHTCHNIKILSLKLVSDCWGCREDQPNQLAHMDYGGCLYTPD